MMPMAKGVEHAGMAGNTLLCNRCGARQELTLPQPIDSVVALMKAWGTAHAKCSGSRRAFRDATSVYDWATSDDTGMSSLAIYNHMKCGVSDGRFPHDPDDFGRCYRLLALAPDWRRRITEMGGYGTEWQALSAAWGELEALYLKELPRGTCPKLYARMKSLVAPPSEKPSVTSVRSTEGESE
jgi:hypothetical protein